MIECFFDDSGKESQPDHRFVVMAGYIGHDGIWFPFIQKWRHLLMRHALPALHMREWVKVCQAKKWGSDQGHIVIRDFVQVIRESQLIGLGIAVDAEAWRGLPSNRRRAFGNAQEFCFQRIMRRVIDRVAAAEERDRIALIFDQDFQFAKPRLGLLERLSKGDPRISQQVAAISFADSRAYYQLQAADLLAWETRRHLVDRTAGRPGATRWQALFESLPYGELDYEGEYWDLSMIEKNFSAVEAELNKSVR